MRAALIRAVGDGPVIGADVTESYKSARAEVFRSCPRIEVAMRPGQAVLLDPFVLHGVAPWKQGDTIPDEGRMVAYFRPLHAVGDDWIR